MEVGDCPTSPPTSMLRDCDLSARQTACIRLEEDEGMLASSGCTHSMLAWLGVGVLHSHKEDSMKCVSKMDLASCPPAVAVVA